MRVAAAPAPEHAAPQPRPQPVRPTPVADPTESPFWRGGGRSVRVPVGYVFVAGAVVFALCVGAYVLGAHQGRRAERDQYARDAAAAWLGPDADPLNAPDSLSGATTPQTNAQQQATRPTQPQARPQPSQQQTQPQQTARPPVQTGAGRLTEGLNHFVIARLGPDEAHRAATYLRSNGLEVGVFPADNPRFREVISLQGFGAGSGQDGIGGPEAARLRSEIRRVGRLYRSQESGPTDFADVYAFKIDARRARMTAETPR